MEYFKVVIGDVDVDRLNSPYGKVRLYIPGKSKEKWWHYFSSYSEWKQFYDLWRELRKPYQLELAVSVKFNKWRFPK